MLANFFELATKMDDRKLATRYVRRIGNYITILHELDNIKDKKVFVQTAKLWKQRYLKMNESDTVDKSVQNLIYAFNKVVRIAYTSIIKHRGY